MRLPAFSVLIALMAGCAEGDEANNVCGIQRSSHAIINGDESAARMTSAQEDAVGQLLVHYVGRELPVICSGFLITPRWFVTARHCVRKSPGDEAPRLEVRFGAAAAAPIFKTTATNVVVHESADIALVELAEAHVAASPLPVSLPISFPIANRTFPTRVVIAGYGTTEKGVSGLRRFVEEEVLDVTALHIRVTGFGKTGACFGDSGGPLLSVMGSRPVVLGVLAKGPDTCRGSDEYVRTDGVASWFQSVTEAQPLDCL